MGSIGPGDFPAKNCSQLLADRQWKLRETRRAGPGSAIYLSLDRRDYNLLSRKLHEECQTPGSVTRSLWKPWQHTCRHNSDSDWAGCLETRRSTDSHLAIVAGAVVTCTTQTQPGLPATSSPDAELGGVSRAAREGIFLKVKDLIILDFGQPADVREALPMDRQFIGDPSFKLHWPWSQTASSRGVWVLRAGSLAGQAVVLGESHGNSEMCEFSHKASQVWNGGATSNAGTWNWNVWTSARRRHPVNLKTHQCESIPNQQTANMEDTNPSFCRLDSQAGRRSGKECHGDPRECQGQCH